MDTRVLGFAVIMLTASIPALAGQACVARSGERQASLVELYTSEGCNSCPPADRWLSALAKDANASVIPIAFHVDYWDHLGWRDRFASPAFSRRQRERVASEGGRVVYTPQVMVNGRSRPAWASAATADLETAGPARSMIELAAHAELQVAARLTNASEASDAEVYVALVEDGLQSSVAAGENGGALLKHDAVVRRLDGPFAFERQGTLQRSLPIALPAGVNGERSAWVAFVQRRGDGHVLQALRLSAAGCADRLRP